MIGGSTFLKECGSFVHTFSQVNIIIIHFAHTTFPRKCYICIMIGFFLCPVFCFRIELAGKGQKYREFSQSIGASHMYGINNALRGSNVIFFKSIISNFHMLSHQ